MGQRMGAKRTSLGCIFGVATTSFVKISRPRGKLSSLKAPLAMDVGMLSIVSVYVLAIVRHQCNLGDSQNNETANTVIFSIL